jgi:integrase
MDTTPYNGYQHLLDLFKQAQTEAPKGVSLKRSQKGNRQYISLQMTIGDKRREKSCNCDFTQIGIVTALDKAKKVSEALPQFNTESDFLDWYDKTILEKNIVRNDLLSFTDGIKLVSNYYWNHRKKTGRERIKGNPSDETTYHDVYGQYFDLISDKSKIVSLSSVMSAINQKTKGTRTYVVCIQAFRKLCELSGLTSIKNELDKLDTQQTVFRKLQSVSLDEFIEFRNKVLGGDISLTMFDGEEFNPDQLSRINWMYVFSMQVVYGLRISEVFAIQNIDKDFTTTDNVIIPKLNSGHNKDMVCVIGAETISGTSTKTGYRLAIPFIPPTHPYLIDQLGIRSGELPKVSVEGTDRSKVHRYTSNARKKLTDWGKKYGFITQTHALRHLANLNGMMAGIPLEQRALSLGHSPEMNDKVYKKRSTTKTTLDVLTKVKSQTIPLESAINVLRSVINDNNKELIVKVLSVVYNTNNSDIEKIFLPDVIKE